MQDATQPDKGAAAPDEYFPADRPWVEKDGAMHLVGVQCAACGTKAFPARDVCSECGAESGLEPVHLSSRGTLYTYSEVHVAPKDFPTPYVIGYVDLDDGVRVFAQIEGPASRLQPDQKVETTTGVVRRRANGTSVISYKFRSVPS